MTDPREREGPDLLRGRDVYEITELKREGLSVKSIGELLGYDRKTVRKYLRNPEAVPGYGREPSPSKLDRYKPYLADRLKAGVWNAQVLLRELKERGYQGGYTILEFPGMPVATWPVRSRAADSPGSGLWLQKS